MPAATVVVAAVVAVGLYFRSRHGAPLTEKDTIVLADFANSTGDTIFSDDTLARRRSTFPCVHLLLNVLPDRQVAKTLQQMTRPAGGPNSPRIGPRGLSASGQQSIPCRIHWQPGQRIRAARLRPVNCQKRRHADRDPMTTALKEKVLDALGRAATKLRSELESLAAVPLFDVPLYEATTSSLEALKAYSLGGKALNEKGPAAALPYDQRAIELDPNFAMGYVAVGNDYFTLAEVGRASEYITKAFQLRDHASEREKLVIAAEYYLNVTGELDKAAQTYQEHIQSYPRLTGVYANLGVVYGEQGQYEKAAEVTRQGSRVAPDLAAPYSNLANYALALQQFDEARQIAHEAQARKQDNPKPRAALYALAFLGARTLLRWRNSNLPMVCGQARRELCISARVRLRGIRWSCG